MKSITLLDKRLRVYENGKIMILDKQGNEKREANSFVLRNRSREVLLSYCNVNGKQYHFYPKRLVAELFAPNPNNYPYVEQIDGDIYNLSANNLRWLSQSEVTRKMKKTRNENTTTCEVCGNKYHKKYNECPRCAMVKKKELEKQEKKNKKLLKVKERFYGISLENLKPQYRYALEMALSGRTLQAIGDGLGVSRERARQILVDIEKGKGCIKKKAYTIDLPSYTTPNNLKFWRKSAGLTQEELADMIGVSKISIHKMEKSKSPLRRVNKLAIAYALSIDANLIDD